MPSNPNIALSVKAPQFRNPLETVARAQQIAANAMAVQKTQREAAAVNALRDYYKGGGRLNTAADIEAAAQAGVDPAVAQEIAKQNLEFGKFGVEQKKIDTARLFNRLGAVAEAGAQGDDTPWIKWLDDYSRLGDEEFREAGEFLAMTKGKYNPSVVKSLMAGAEKFFEKTTPQATTELVIGQGGRPLVVNRGGGVAPTIVKPKYFEPGPQPAVTQTPTAREVEVGEPFNIGGVGGPEASALDGGVASVLANVKSDREYQDVLKAIEMQNPNAAAAIRQAMPTFDPSRMEGIRAEAVRAFGGVGGPDIPLVAGPRGGPYEGYIEAPLDVRLKDPSVSPYPGSAQVPLPRVASEAGAEEGGRKAAARIEQLKTDLPKAHSQTTSLINNLTDRINRIDKFLRNPYRNTVIGSIEGRIPEFLMNERRADAIADWKFITNNSVLDKLIEDRRSTETGASPQGLVSDRDLSVAASAANSLTRTGSEPAQEAEMKRLRDVLYRTRETALKSYNNTYSNLVKSDPRFRLSPPPVSPKYTGPLTGKRTSSGATVENWD